MASSVPAKLILCFVLSLPAFASSACRRAPDAEAAAADAPAIPQKGPAKDPSQSVMVNFYISSEEAPRYGAILKNLDRVDATKGVVLRFKGTVQPATGQRLGLGKSWRWFDEGPTRVGDVVPETFGSIDAHKIYAEPEGRFVAPESVVPEGTTVYRGMEIDRHQLDSILEEGIAPPVVFFHAGDAYVADHQLGNSITGHQYDPRYSIFVSASYDQRLATTFAGANGIVFKIAVPANKAISVNDALGEKSMYPNEKEVVIAGHVDPDTILGYYVVTTVNKKRVVSEYVCLRDCN